MQAIVCEIQFLRQDEVSSVLYHAGYDAPDHGFGLSRGLGFDQHRRARNLQIFRLSQLGFGARILRVSLVGGFPRPSLHLGLLF